MAALKLMQLEIPALTRFSAKGSVYDFASLTVGGPAMVDTDVVDHKKAHSRVSSALTAYRKRSGDQSKFTVRIVKLEDGTDAVGVWKLAEAPAADEAAEPAEVAQQETEQV